MSEPNDIDSAWPDTVPEPKPEPRTFEDMRRAIHQDMLSRVGLPAIEDPRTVATPAGFHGLLAWLKSRPRGHRK